MPSSLMKPPPATVAVADPRNVTSHNIRKVVGSACEARFAFLSPNHQATYLQRHSGKLGTVTWARARVKAQMEVMAYHQRPRVTGVDAMPRFRPGSRGPFLCYA